MLGNSKTVLILTVILAIAKSQHDPQFAPGRNVIVQMFEWTWNDIAEECERFLGPNGYGGIQVSPVSENVIITEPFRPWYERYQTVSYNNMQTRSGNEQEFAAMVRRCNDAGVRTYVDVVINHMTGSGMAGHGTGGSFYNASTRDYPEYSEQDFNNNETCPSASGQIEDWSSPVEIRNCELVGLVDLNQSKEYVRSHIVEFMNKLLNFGIAGFRVDAAKHMWPEDLKIIYDRLNNLSSEHGFSSGARPFIYQEVQPGNDQEPGQGSEYFHLGRVTEFKFGRFLGETFRGYNQLKVLKNWGPEWGMHPSEFSLPFLDNHDTQRGHGGGGLGITLTYRQARIYKMATAFMLAHPYGVARLMSSYYWEERIDNGQDQNDWIGPPNDNGVTLPVIINPDLTCGNGWICEHRWRQIFHMVKFRNVVAGTELTNWYDDDDNQIAFCRGDKGFIAMNNGNGVFNASIPACVSPGEYCDVISGSKYNGQCTGNTITVGSDGRANIYIGNNAEDPIIAIHAESKL